MPVDYPLVARMVISRLNPTTQSQGSSILYIRRVPETGEIRMNRTELMGRAIDVPDTNRLSPIFSASPADAVEKVISWLTEKGIYQILNLDQPVVDGWSEASLNIPPVPGAASAKA
ncbi:hypothetical protein [Belnapia sp. F-4-1]|uniref:hypothetical protein n=1 Tax=Belnapia sp. F-4-1 TaxID=1545443 RepID=UPI0011866CB1|nr:hypothetical protein [Belnapia sp. F-4-1]